MVKLLPILLLLLPLFVSCGGAPVRAQNLPYGPTPKPAPLLDSNVLQLATGFLTTMAPNTQDEGTQFNYIYAEDFSGDLLKKSFLFKPESEGTIMIRPRGVGGEGCDFNKVEIKFSLGKLESEVMTIKHNEEIPVSATDYKLEVEVANVKQCAFVSAVFYVELK